MSMNQYYARGGQELGADMADYSGAYEGDKARRITYPDKVANPNRVKISHSAEVRASGYFITMEALRSLCANQMIPDDAEVRVTSDSGGYGSDGSTTVRVTWTK